MIISENFLKKAEYFFANEKRPQEKNIMSAKYTYWRPEKKSKYHYDL